MKPSLSLLFLMILLTPNCLSDSPAKENKPVIGIFSLPSGFYLTHDMGMFSYIAVEYVELLKQSGA